MDRLWNGALGNQYHRHRHAIGFIRPGPCSYSVMGFGSYDESEQQDQSVEADEDDGVSVHDEDHDGDVSFESDMSTDELVGQLQSMKSEDEHDEE